jgi:hypothetical protein
MFDLKTFEDLYKALGHLTQSPRDGDLTSCDYYGDGEFYQIGIDLMINDENEDMGDVLDDKHPYFHIVYK